MKKILFTILFCMSWGVVCAFTPDTLPSDCLHFLDFYASGNYTDTGSAAITWTNNGAPVTNTQYYDTGYSAGVFTGYRIYSQQTSSATHTFDFEVYMPSGNVGTIQGAICIYDLDYSFIREIYMYTDGTMSFVSNGTYLTGMTFSKDAWHEVQLDCNGTYDSIYIDNTYKGHVADAHIPTNFYVSVGYSCTYFSWDGYIDRYIESNVDYNGSPIPTATGAVATNTFTPTPNLTQTAAATLTEIAQTATANAAATLTATALEPYWTPTIQYTPPICLTPMFSGATPIITPQATFEGGCVVEPNMIEPKLYDGVDRGPNEKYWCLCSNNAFYLNGGVETIEMFTAPTPMGPWTRVGTGPIIGGGYGGEPNPCGQGKFAYVSGQWRIYFSDLTNRDTWYATSTDGHTWTSRFPGISLTPCMSTAAWIPFGCAGGSAMDGVGLISDGSLYWNLTELNAQNCSTCIVPYVLWITKDFTGDAEQFEVASADALWGMDPFYPAHHLFGGSRGIIKTGSDYYNATSVDVPTSLYMSVSNDLFNWRTSATPIATPWASMFGLSACNQAVDGTMLETTDDNGGKNVYVVFDGTDNNNGACAIGVMIHHGSAASMDSCSLPSQTFTPTDSPTPTVTITPQAVVTISASTTMILGQQYTVNLAGSLIGNFMSSNEEFLYSYANFNIVGQTPTPSIPGTYYNDGPKNGTYSESVSIQLIPLTPGNYNLFGDYITYLANGNAFNNYNSLNITVITATFTPTPFIPTATITPICSATFTNTPIIIKTSTFTYTLTPASPTFTATPTVTQTNTHIFTPTFTPTITKTSTITPTPIIVTILPISTYTTSICTESYNLTGALGYVIEFIPTGYEINVPVWDNISANPFYFQYLVNMSGVPNRSKITGIELFVKKNNSNTGAWVLQGPQPVWACNP